METLVYPLRELVQKQGRGYEFTIFENESTILLFGVGRENDFTDSQKESGGTGVISSDAAFFCFTEPFQALGSVASPLHLREPG